MTYCETHNNPDRSLILQMQAHNMSRPAGPFGADLIYYSLIRWYLFRRKYSIFIHDVRIIFAKFSKLATHDDTIDHPVNVMQISGDFIRIGTGAREKHETTEKNAPTRTARTDK